MQALVSSNGRFELTAVPAPRTEAPDSVLVNIECISLNRGETTVPWWPDEPVGWDAYGTVARTSADGLGPSVGTRVATWAYSGAWAQKRVVSRHNLAVVPVEVDDATAAALPVAGLTALHAVQKAMVKPGERVAVTGALGGVGHLAVQLAANAGAHVLALTRDPSRASVLGSPFRSPRIEVTTVDRARQHGELNAIIDTVGGPVLSGLAEHLASQGRVIMVGAAMGRKAELDTGRLASKHADLISVAIPTPVGADLETLLDLVAADQLTVSTVDGGGWIGLADQSPADSLGLGKTIFHVTDPEKEALNTAEDPKRLSMQTRSTA